ncbi:MAG TPA: acyl-CoA dehydrogenase family protein [Gemmatimonadaceae bacterium]|nr:acyl-CoA dehydrogenase family protein [Gemmatimonadaceae bacterium]
MPTAEAPRVLAPGLEHLEWPFFEDEHRELARAVGEWAGREVHEPPASMSASHGEVDAECRALVRLLGEAGWLRHVVPAPHGGLNERVDARSLCLLRESLARRSALADFALAMQGLGAGPIALHGDDAQQRRYLPGVASGERIAAFAISEAGAGSDIAAMQTTARRDGAAWVLDGEKTWISNAGIADHYVVFARLAGAGADAGFVALIVDADARGLSVAERIALAAPHPLGTLRFDGCRVGSDRLLGEPGKGLRVALGTLDLFRPSVGAAALGLARRAMDEALAWTRERTVFGRALAEHQMTQVKLADMAVRIDASALLVYRAAWTRDRLRRRTTREAAMAKLHATESAQLVIDDAVQLLGARGVRLGAPVERLYREIRALRIYEGTSEIQRIVIANAIGTGS